MQDRRGGRCSVLRCLVVQMGGNGGADWCGWTRMRLGRLRRPEPEEKCSRWGEPQRSRIPVTNP